MRNTYMLIQEEAVESKVIKMLKAGSGVAAGCADSIMCVQIEWAPNVCVDNLVLEIEGHTERDWIWNMWPL